MLERQRTEHKAREHRRRTLALHAPGAAAGTRGGASRAGSGALGGEAGPSEEEGPAPAHWPRRAPRRPQPGGESALCWRGRGGTAVRSKAGLVLLPARRQEFSSLASLTTWEGTERLWVAGCC